MKDRRLAVAVIVSATMLQASLAYAQAVLPAPLPGQVRIAAADDVPALAQEECEEEFRPLREDAEKKGQLIKAAAARHATPQEACRLIGAYVAAEVKMIAYVEANAAKCRIPDRIANQLKAGHANTEQMHRKVCDVARQAGKQGAAGPSGDFDHVLAPPSVIPRTPKDALLIGDFPLIRR